MTADRIRAFTGLILPPVAWYVFQQGLGFTLRGSCSAAGIPAGHRLRSMIAMRKGRRGQQAGRDRPSEASD